MEPRVGTEGVKTVINLDQEHGGGNSVHPDTEPLIDSFRLKKGTCQTIPTASNTKLNNNF